MGKKKSLSPTKRAKIVTMFEVSKLPKKEIARRLEIDPSTVRYTLKKYYDSGGSSASFKDSPKSGAPRKLDLRSIRRLIRLVEEDRRKTARMLRDELALGGGPSVSVTTIKRYFFWFNRPGSCSKAFYIRS